MNIDLLNLPWEAQIALASGYAAYMLAYAGLRHSHRAIDTALIALVFSLIASATLALGKSLTLANPVLLGALAFCMSTLSGLLWRKWGRDFVSASLRLFDISWSNDDPSAFVTLTGSTHFYVTQVAVLLDDGTWLRCDHAEQFIDAPFGPCQLGPNGDIALYLTHEEAPDGQAKPLSTVRNAAYGDRITYIPASRIQRITIRHVPKSSGPLRAAESDDRAQ
jgi:hypothetical protein